MRILLTDPILDRFRDELTRGGADGHDWAFLAGAPDAAVAAELPAADVLVDFTVAPVAERHLRIAVEHGIAPVVGGVEGYVAGRRAPGDRSRRPEGGRPERTRGGRSPSTLRRLLAQAERALAEALRTAPDGDADAICEHLLTELAYGDLDDDVALLVVRVLE